MKSALRLTSLKKRLLSVDKRRFFMAESKGFEPLIRLWRIHDFQSCSFGQTRTTLHRSQAVLYRNQIKKSSSGNGPIDAFINTIKQLDYSIDFKDYAQKSNNDNSEKSKAITYINISHDGRDIWAIGEDENIIKSSFNGIISAINRI